MVKAREKYLVRGDIQDDESFRNLILISWLNLFPAHLYPFVLVLALSFNLNSSSLSVIFTSPMYL